MSFDTVSSNTTLHPTPFQTHISEQELAELKQLLALSKLGPKTFENLDTDPKSQTGFGIPYEWMQSAEQHWDTTFDWRETEKRNNVFPIFIASIEHDDHNFDIHFVALFSKRRDGIPIVLMHRCPGSFLEFLGVLDEFRNEYDENTLPYHLIVPSLPGYACSSGPPLGKDFFVEDAAGIINKLMIGLGFGHGYVAQGGDIGSFVACILGTTADACKPVHCTSLHRSLMKVENCC